MAQRKGPDSLTTALSVYPYYLRCFNDRDQTAAADAAIAAGETFVERWQLQKDQNDTDTVSNAR